MANVIDALGYALATICRDLDCFTRPGIAGRIPVCLAEADAFASARRPAFGPVAVAPLRPVLSPPEDRPPLSGPDRRQRWIGWARRLFGSEILR